MVEINSTNKQIKVNVSSAGSGTSIGLSTPQNYYDNLAKQWAISKNIVNNEDFSSKHYAEESKTNSEASNNVLNAVLTEHEEITAEIASGRTNIASDIATGVETLQTEGNTQKEAVKAEGNAQVAKVQAEGSNYATKAEAKYTAGAGIAIENNVISNTQSSAEWGNIEGNIVNQTDLNDILTAQQTKITELNATSRSYLLGAYENGTSWWRVYSDGWIEQGGVGTGPAGAVHITFLKQFKSTSYVLHCQNHQNTTVAWSNRFGFNKSVTGFDFANDAGVPFDWMAVGY